MMMSINFKLILLFAYTFALIDIKAAGIEPK